MAGRGTGMGGSGRLVTGLPVAGGKSAGTRKAKTATPVVKSRAKFTPPMSPAPTPPPTPPTPRDIDQPIVPFPTSIITPHAHANPTTVKRDLNKAAQIAEELLARECEKSAYAWMTKGTMTKDEQADEGVNPYRPYPHDWPHIKATVQYLDRYSRKLAGIWKSRTMLESWIVAGWCTHYAFTHPATRVLYQSKDEARSVNMMTYSKILWTNSLERLKLRWKLAKPIEQQSYNTFETANDSVFEALPRDSTKIKSFHPTIVVWDEAAIMDNFDECLSEAVGAQAKFKIALSSSWLGHMNDLWEASEPVDWPEELMAEMKEWASLVGREDWV